MLSRASTSLGCQARAAFVRQAHSQAPRTKWSAVPAIAAGVGVASASCVTAFANDNMLHAPALPWEFNGMLSSYDCKSIKRGHLVYTQICATCHSLTGIAFRNLVGVTHTEDEAKALAEDIDVIDGPDDEGNMFERSGKLADYFPSPYKNEQEARFANGGAYPPDLTLIIKARHGGPDYVFALLTGYKDPPAGVPERDDQYYNPYFSGGWIGMAQQLHDGDVEYEDGTPATITQMAKDVCAFLQWTAEPEHDERKRQGFKFLTGLAFGAFFMAYYKRYRWNVLKTRRVVLV